MTKPHNDHDFPGAYFNADGHDLYFVSTAQDRLAAVLAVIASARISLRLVIYMFHNDYTGQLVTAALIDALGRGVTVHLMIDGFGSRDTPDVFFASFAAAGGYFNRFSSRRNAGYFIRNHQKIVIADDIHALIGGFNITDEYFGRAGDKSWEDFGVVVSGAKVGDLARYCDDLIQLSRDGGVRLLQLRSKFGGWHMEGGGLRWALGGPSNRMSPWALSLKRDLQEANRLHLASAYFSPSRSILRRIAGVTGKGQSVLVLAGKTDNGATIPAARALYRYLLKRGADIYEYQPRPLHMKLLVIDDISYIGSSNLDVRSLFINLEIMLRIDDGAVAEYLRGHIAGMMAASERQTPALHRARSGFFARMKWGLAYMLVNSIDYTVGRRIRFSLLRGRS